MSFKWVGLSTDGNTVTLRKLNSTFPLPSYVTPEWMSANPHLVRTGIALDVETTGLDRTQDKIIEIGLQRFLFNCSNGDLLAVQDSFSSFQDPGMPLTEEIKTLTGIDDSMIQGKTIDWEKVGHLISDAQLIIAHNAGFDRPFIERSVEVSASKIWGCSFKQIDWRSKGYPTQKLEILGIYHGFFTDAHRALNDVHALLYLLSLPDQNTGKPYLNELLINARRPTVHVLASKAPFEAKNLLKSRGYSWDNAQRVWNKHSYKDELPQELSWLEEFVYAGRFEGSTREIPITDHFKIS